MNAYEKKKPSSKDGLLFLLHPVGQRNRLVLTQAYLKMHVSKAIVFIDCSRTVVIEA